MVTILAHTMYHHSHFTQQNQADQFFSRQLGLGCLATVFTPGLSSRHPGNSGLMKSHNNGANMAIPATLRALMCVSFR
jgi:hypothetical protein